MKVTFRVDHLVDYQLAMLLLLSLICNSKNLWQTECNQALILVCYGVMKAVRADLQARVMIEFIHGNAS